MISLNIPDTSKASAIADWVELYVANDRDELSKAALASHIEASSGSEPTESDINSVWQEMEYRLSLYGETPPYEVEGDLIVSTIDWQDIPEYMTCIIFSLEGNAEEPGRGGVLFERITCESIRNYIQGEALIYGHPERLTVRELAYKMNEEFNCEPPLVRNDRDLDVVAWKPFGDRKGSQVVMLVQCAAGHNWKGKMKDLNLDAWCRYIFFGSTPIRGFSIPSIISDRAILSEIYLDAGLLIDRARLYKYLVNETPADNLRDDLNTWCNERLDDILH